MLKVALLGAESTGKTWLANALVQRAEKHQFTFRNLPEPLRLWCEQRGRTPTASEQWPLAHAHALALAQAFQAPCDGLLADTTPLQTAAYSAVYFEDHGLDVFAAQVQRQFDLTLVMGLDLAWQADPGQRSGPDSQGAVDARLRDLLGTHQISFSVIYGHGEQRLEQAWRLLQAARDASAFNEASEVAVQPPNTPLPPHGWACAHCGDPDCERRLFGLLTAP